MNPVDLGIIIPLVVLPIVLIGVFVWYRRSIADMKPTDSKPVSGHRLTAEALHRSPSPPWRVVYEIGGALGGVDHVIVGPVGVVAVTTVVADRPEPGQLLGTRAEAQLVSEAAIARGPIDELLRAVGASCSRSATIYWGIPTPTRAAADDVVHGSQLVEGQRLAEWMTTLAEQAASTTLPLEQARIDAVWRTIVMGIGRPDPLPSSTVETSTMVQAWPPPKSSPDPPPSYSRR